MNPAGLSPSTSHAQWLEDLGPLNNSKPCFDVHANDSLCWGYTMVMVVVQVLAFGKVSAARSARKVKS